MNIRWISYSKQVHLDFCAWLEERAQMAEREGRTAAAHTIRQTLEEERQQFSRPLTRLVNAIADAARMASRR